jgi:hypothetical protein
MVVLNFIVGLVVMVMPFLIVYLLGIFILKIKGEYDENTDYVEIFIHGLLGLLIAVVGLLLICFIYISGESIVNSLL